MYIIVESYNNAFFRDFCHFDKNKIIDIADLLELTI